MGLLSGFVGDESIKDEYGMTQADRRQPLFSGLLQAGMLGMAAGENITPGQRAQLMGQMGGAIAGIPEAMQKQVGEAAQMQLRRQQFLTNQQKFDAIKKMQAYAETPEYQTMIAALPDTTKAGLKIAIAAGDVDSFQRLMTGSDAQALKHERFKFDQEKAAADRDLKQRQFELRVSQAGGWGNGPEGQAREKLLKGRNDPTGEYVKTPDYKMAWDYLSKERPFSSGGNTIVLPKLPDLDDYPTPGATAAPGSPNAANPPAAPAAPPEAGKPRQNPDGSTSWIDPASPKEVLTEWEPGGKIRVTDLNGNFIRTEEPPPIPESTRKEFAEQEGFRKQIAYAQKTFLDLWNSTPLMQRIRAIATPNHPLNAAWVNLVMPAKGKNLYELGVLNEGDLPQLQKAITDPSTIGSLLSSGQDVQQILQIMTGAIEAKAKGTQDAYRESRRRAPKVDGGGGGAKGGKRKISRFNPATNKIEEVEVD